MNTDLNYTPFTADLYPVSFASVYKAREFTDAQRAVRTNGPEDSALEFHNIGCVDHDRIDIDISDICSIYAGIGACIDIAQIKSHGTLVTDFVVEASMQGQTHGIIEVNVGPSQRSTAPFIKEDDVIYPNPNEGGHRCLVGEMILQRQSRGQLIGFRYFPNAGEGKLVLKRGRYEQFDADIVEDKIFSGEGCCDPGSYFYISRGCVVVTVCGFNDAKTNAELEIPFGLGQGRCCAEGSKRNREAEAGEVFHDCFLQLCVDRDSTCLTGVHIDVSQVLAAMPHFFKKISLLTNLWFDEREVG